MINRTQEEIMKKWPKGWISPLASIRCITFNHETFIEQALDSFLMQETSFPFEIVVHDDASTDSTVNIIKEYEKKYPQIVKPIYETENQYSKRNGSLVRIMNAACKGKYWAICEGDDYWINPNKLQMQVDWLENHPDYTMCCSDAVIESPDGILDWHWYGKDCDIPVKDMILGGGRFVQTATLTYRGGLLDGYPKECMDCHVGDYPLQLWAVLNGKVRFFSIKTATYRYSHNGSWTDSQKKMSIELLIKKWQSEIDMLQALDEFSHYQFHKIFKRKQNAFILENSLFASQKVRDKKTIRKILSSFSEINKSFSLLQKADVFFAIVLPALLYRIVRGSLFTVKTLLWPSRRNIRYFLIKLQDLL